MDFGHELSTGSLLKLISFVSWSWLYLWFAGDGNKSPEWGSRAVTLLHGSVASVVGLYQCGAEAITPCRLTMKVMPWHYALMLWSWGYFAFDLLWCFVYWSDHYLMLFHHISALVAVTIYTQKDSTGCTFACTLAFLEVTNPLLQIRWFLKNAGLSKSVLYTMVEVSYLVMFLFVRGILGTYIVMRILRSELFDLEEKLISLVFYFVSVAFIYDIVGYVVYRYKPKIEGFRNFLEHAGLILNEHL